MPVQQLIDVLESLRQKAKALSLVYGLGLLLAAFAGASLFVVAADYFLDLAAIPRMVLLLGSFVLLGYVGYRFIVKPASERVTLSDMAGRVETVFPEFDDRLRSAVNFATTQDKVGSERMRSKVMTQAGDIAAHVNFSQVIQPKPALFTFTGGVAALLVLVLGAVLIGQTYRGIIASRLFTPFDAADWPTQQVIGLPATLPEKVPAGQRVMVEITVDKGDREDLRPIAKYRTGDGQEREVFLERIDGNRYAATLDTRLVNGDTAAPLNIRVEAGDAEATLAPVQIVPRLRVESVSAVATPPAYVPSRDEKTFDLARGTAVVGQGSSVTLRVAFNKQLGDMIDLVPLGETQLPELPWVLDGNTATASFVAEDSLRFRVNATDADGFKNSAVGEYGLLVRPDQSPTIVIEQPRRNERRTADTTVPLIAAAEDDYGFDGVELRVRKLGGPDEEPVDWVVPLVAEAEPVDGVGWTRSQRGDTGVRFRLVHDWKPADLDGADLEPGDVLEYQLAAQDNYERAGSRHAPALSGKLRITIISQEDLSNEIIDDLRQIRDQVSAVRGRQERTRQETSDLAQDTRDKQELDEADQATAKRLVRDQSAAAGAAKRLAQQVQELQDRLEENASEDEDLTDLTETVAEKLERAAEEPMKEATGELSTAASEKAAQPRREQALEDAGQAQQQAVAQLEDAIQQMENIGSLRGAIEQLENLLDKQREAAQATREAVNQERGKDRADVGEDTQEKLDAAAEQQREVAEQTQKAIEQMEKMAEQMKQSDPEASEAMQQAAQTAQRRNVTQQQQEAAEQTEQNAGQQAQQNQQQVELGMEMILRDLKEAEKQQLARMQRKLAELQEQVATLIRRQAGHNVDNLALRGAEGLEAVAAEVVAELLATAERLDAEGNPVPPDRLDANILSQSQQQTERNTRSISKDAEEQRNGGEVAAKLTRAAGRMERAIIMLRDRDLPGAYPSMDEALASLREAKTLLDEQKNEVDEQVAQQQRDAIRQRLIQTRTDQIAINERTAELEAKRVAGELNRADRLELTRMPAGQGKLADSMNGISSDLAGLGGVVYVWTANQVRDGMNAVKQKLADSDTAAGTQAQQATVIAQLDAMIENLKQEPREQEFEQRQQGGGGGGGGGGDQPSFPTVTELKLLQSIQQTVNDATIEQAAIEPRNEGELERLGARQGEMRNLLDELLRKASRGEMQLGPEPDNRDQLPEEVTEQEVEDDELMAELLGGNEGQNAQEKQVNRIGDRMARSRQRLAINHDPGKTTQIIQRRIQLDFDDLIAQAREQQSQQQQQQGGGGGEQQAAQPNQGQPQGGQANAQQNAAAQGNAEDSTDGTREMDVGEAVTGGDIAGAVNEWGQLTERQRQAVIEGTDDQTLPAYEQLVRDYYRGLNEKAQGE
ncbi:MAG: hypothetical protein AAGD32_05600 [Planctomycetota bacterium]